MLSSTVKEQINALCDQLLARGYLGSEEIKVGLRDELRLQAAEYAATTAIGREKEVGRVDQLSVSVGAPSGHFSRLDLTLQFAHDPQRIVPQRMEMHRDGKKTQLLFQAGRELPPAESLLPQALKRRAHNRGLPGQLYGKSRITGRRR